MKTGQFAQTLAALAAAMLASGCNGSAITIGDEDGKPLSELDLTGTPPHGVVLSSPDEVRLRQGDTFAITVDGDADAAGAVRFTLKDGSLGVLRQPGLKLGNTAIINITMPAPDSLIAAGSGTITAESLASKANVTIAGSGRIETMNIAAQDLKVTIAGSGSYRAAGTAASLTLTIAGSGDAAMDALKADSATIRIAGSGRSAFASDGTVKANVVGSGQVRVSGRATCEIKSAGSGKLVCTPAPA